MTSILLVEDATDLAQVIIRELETAGYQVSLAGDGISALATLSQQLLSPYSALELTTRISILGPCQA